MESWVIPFGALAALSILEGLVLVVILRRIGGLYSWLDGAMPASPDRTGLAIGSEIPPFTATGIDGAPWAQEDLLGRPYVLALVHPGCRYCQGVLALLHDTAKQHEGRVEVVLVTSADGEAAKRYAATHDISLPLVTIGADGPQRLFGTSATPFAFGVDRLGIVRAKGVIRTDPPNVLDFFVAAQSEHGRRDRRRTLEVSPSRA